MITPQTYNQSNANMIERHANVLKSLELWPELRRFNASYYIDESCRTILRKMAISISPDYFSDEKGYGYIHAGKVGHWCSFLRFLLYCQSANVKACVWIEDDILLSKKGIDQISGETFKFIDKSTRTAILSIGLGDTVNIIN